MNKLHLSDIWNIVSYSDRICMLFNCTLETYQNGYMADHTFQQISKY